MAEGYNLDKLSLVSVYGTKVFWNKHGFTETNTGKNKKLESYGKMATYMIRDL